MARRSPADVYADLIAAGFDAAAATIMVAIAGAESGWDDAAQGDLGLQTDQWGPSYGLYQIRTLKGDTGTGSWRDITFLTGSPSAQAKAAYAISGGGRDFTPWTTFTSGAYQSFLGKANEAAATTPGPFPTFGPDWLPWNWAANAANKTVAQGLGGARQIALEAMFVVGGLALVLAGGYLAARRPVHAIDVPRRAAKKAVLG